MSWRYHNPVQVVFGTVIPTLLACTEKRGPTTGAELLLGAIAGFEVGPRVGSALHSNELLSRGWHSGAVVGAHSAAASTASLIVQRAPRDR